MPKGTHNDYFNFGEDTEAIDEVIIDYYNDNPALWQMSNPRYKLGKEKTITIQKLVEQLAKKDLEVRHVIYKWKTLKDHYFSELRKEEKGKTTGADGNGYRSKWQHYQRLRFLSEGNKPRKSVSNFGALEDSTVTDLDQSQVTHDASDHTMSDDENETTVKQCDSHSSASISQQSTSYRSQRVSLNPSSASTQSASLKRCSEKTNPKIKKSAADALSETLQYIRESDMKEEQIDNCSLFGQEIANDLRTLPERDRYLAEIEIRKVVFNYKFGSSFNPGYPSTGDVSYNPPRGASYNPPGGASFNPPGFRTEDQSPSFSHNKPQSSRSLPYHSVPYHAQHSSEFQSNSERQSYMTNRTFPPRSAEPVISQSSRQMLPGFEASASLCTDQSSILTSGPSSETTLSTINVNSQPIVSSYAVLETVPASYINTLQIPSYTRYSTSSDPVRNLSDVNE